MRRTRSLSASRYRNSRTNCSYQRGFAGKRREAGWQQPASSFLRQSSTRLSAPDSSRYNGHVRLNPVRQRSAVDSDAVQTALIETLAAEPDVVAAYLFGSVVRGTAGPMSDVDVGLLVAAERDGEAVCGRVMDSLCRRLRTSRVDVVSLADAPMPLRYRVARDGSVVTSRDRRALERFVVETVLQYLDFQPLRVRAFERMRQAILETG